MYVCCSLFAHRTPLWTNTAVMSASEASSSTSPSQNSTCPHSSSLTSSSCLVHTSDLITPTTSNSGCGTTSTPDAGTAGVECVCQPTSKLEHTASIIDEPPKATSTTNEPKLIPVPPPNPKRCGGAILAHKLWIGNLDKRLTE